MELGLGGRVAFVAAASNGLGSAVVEELARKGASIAFCVRTAMHLNNTAAIASFVSVAEQHFGRAATCNTNSGALPSKPLADTKPGISDSSRQDIPLTGEN
jgi:NAD(P)-dependent dehydrogenase (short-subunit alcohol dehydrogenase family)